jgi:hypothetical protein
MTSTDTAKQSGATERDEAAQRVRQQVEDALELSRYVVATGQTDKDGKPFAFGDIELIQGAAVSLGLLDVKPGAAAGAAAAATFDTAAWNAFEGAYYRVAIATHPVTAETLRNTRYAAGAGRAEVHFGDAGWLAYIWLKIRGYSPAQRFTRWLWLITIFFAAGVFVTEWKINSLGMVADAESVKVSKDFWQALQPWIYGGLGACAYLLRQGHYYIYARSFDLRRTPEYYNRILLGSLSGGAIILFSDYLMSQEDSVSHIGSTALGFIAGYSSDFLFNTIERIITAIFPKVQLDTVKRDKDKKPVTPQ